MLHELEKFPARRRQRPVGLVVESDLLNQIQALDIDAEIDFDEPVDLPPPPPPAPEEEEEPEPEIFVVVENMPELIGGLEGLQKRIKYPEIARRQA